METTINIDNIKCGGCANTIRKNMIEFKGVSDVIVDVEKESVVLKHDTAIDLEGIKQKLHSLGYPEKGTAEGFDKLASGVKSYVSCAIGRLTDDETDKSHKSN